MKIRNRKNGNEFETNREEFERLVVNAGNGYLYEEIGSDMPIEVKSLREIKLSQKKKAGEITEVKLNQESKNK